jgi:uncharacterized protein (DUF1499 family)
MSSNSIHDSARRARVAAAFASIALALGLVCATAALLAGPLYRLGMLPLGAGLGTIRWAATGALAGTTFALLGLLLGAFAGVDGRRGRAGAALVLNLLVAGPPLYMYREVQRLPRIHDVSTDTSDPPTFVAVVPLRKEARNPLDYPAATAEQQKRGYPDIAPLKLALEPARAFERAERAARAMGWDIVAVAPDALRIEATDTTALFGFKDDVVIRIRPLGAGSIVDLRSLSRVGGSDFGANAKRIRAFMVRLSAP